MLSGLNRSVWVAMYSTFPIKLFVWSKLKARPMTLLAFLHIKALLEFAYAAAKSLIHLPEYDQSKWNVRRDRKLSIIASKSFNQEFELPVIAVQSDATITFLDPQGEYVTFRITTDAIIEKWIIYCQECSHLPLLNNRRLLICSRHVVCMISVWCRNPLRDLPDYNRLF